MHAAIAALPALAFQSVTASALAGRLQTSARNTVRNNVKVM
jgi:hypothetical protein